MKRQIGLAILVSTVMLCGNSYAEETKKFSKFKVFTVSGEWIVREPGTPEQHQKVIDELQTSVVITRGNASNEDSTDDNVLATGSFDDGEVVLTGEVDERTNVLISVTKGEEEPMILPAVLMPQSNTSFAVLDQDNTIPGVEDELMLVEEFRIVDQSDDKFSIVGDLSAISDKDLSVAEAYITVGSSNPKEGSFLSNRSNAVLLRDGKFSIEGIATEPLLVAVWVKSLVDVYIGAVKAVVEPGAQIRISPSKSSSSFAPGNKTAELMANSNNEMSMHSEVIEIWQNSSEYLDKLEEYASSIEMVGKEATTDAVKRPSVVFTEMKTIQSTVLTPIAQNLKKPMSALLALEIGARSGLSFSSQLENWDKLATVLDQDLVKRRVLPERESLERQVRIATNEQTIVPGEMAPDFTLSNLEGEKVALYDDILAENKVVLVDFWASWCGPCIEKLPKLKEFHTEYNEKGFEIVFISIDDTFEDWQEGYEDHQVPGINVGDLNGFLGETPVDYGITWIPTEFLLQADGEILNRGLSMEELDELLGDYFGSAKTQDTVDKPGTSPD